jgi:hypothetical protein
VRRADNLTTFMCRLSRNSGASTSWNPKGLSRPVVEKFYLLPLLLLLLLLLIHFITPLHVSAKDKHQNALHIAKIHKKSTVLVQNTYSKSGTHFCTSNTVWYPLLSNRIDNSFMYLFLILCIATFKTHRIMSHDKISTE